jgi:hypothetical protein
MRFMSLQGAALLCLACAAAPVSAAGNLLANSSFEDPVTYDGAPFIGSWEAFSGGAGAVSANSTVTPRTGAKDLELTISGVNNTFAGAFQDVGGLTVGTEATFSGFHQTPNSSTSLGVASEYRIEWRNSTLNTEVSRVQLTVGPTGSQYAPFSVVALVPAGADTARCVYAIQTFGGEPNPGDTGTIYLDDLSFVVTPEPASLTVLAGAAGLLMRRRR